MEVGSATASGALLSKHSAETDSTASLACTTISEQSGVEAVKHRPCPKEGEEAPQSVSAEEDADEPTPAEHAGTIGAGVACTGIAYGLCRLVLTTSSTEDTLDLAHSLATSLISLYGVGNMRSHPLQGRALPPHLASGRGLVVKMFSASLGYFIGDFLKVCVDVLIRGKYPNLWQGRLAHHVVQLGANCPGIFCRGRPGSFSLAWRSVLCMAYSAEISNIFLRLSNMLRHRPLPGPAGARLDKAVTWALVTTFFLFRIVNFWFVVPVFIKARSVMPPKLFTFGTTVQFMGYTLSTVWFWKIVLIALKKEVRGA